MRTSISFVVMLVLTGAGALPASARGIADRMGEITKPDHGEQPEKDGSGDAAARKDGAAAATKVEPAKDDQTERRIKELEGKLRKMKGVDIGSVRPIDDLDRAEKHVTKMRAALEKARKDLTIVDLEETKRLAKKKLEFDKKWEKYGEAIRKGEKPEGMSAELWAALCDDYYGDRAELEADFAEAKERLEAGMKRRLALFERSVREAEKHYKLIKKKYKGASEGTRKLMARMMGWRAHQARMLALREALARLRQLRADRQGSGESRKDPIEREAVEQTGFLLADALRRLVLRELVLSDATQEPSRADLDKGLRMPEWMNEKDGLARERAKLKWLAEQLRLAHKGLLRAEQEIAAEDEARLDYLRADGASDAEVRKQQAKLQKTRQKRLGARRQKLNARRNHWKAELGKAQAILDRMEGKTTPPPVKQ